MNLELKEAIPEIKKSGTNGCNYDIDTDMIIKWLEDVNKLCNFTITEIDDDALMLKFSSLPNNISEFCKSVYAICPDTIDQGYGCIAEMIENTEEEINEEIRNLVEGVDLEKEDCGLLLMEKDLKTTMEIGLWWD